MTIRNTVIRWQALLVLAGVAPTQTEGRPPAAGGEPPNRLGGSSSPGRRSSPQP